VTGQLARELGSHRGHLAAHARAERLDDVVHCDRDVDRDLGLELGLELGELGLELAAGDRRVVLSVHR
jgi:hypothetical protein